MKKKVKVEETSLIVIDPYKNLEFSNEKELHQFFSEDISKIEKFVSGHRVKGDVPKKEWDQYDELLDETLNDPDEIWENNKILDQTYFIYLRDFPKEQLFYLVFAYCVDAEPSFIYFHLPSRSDKLIQLLTQGELIYDRSIKDVYAGSVDGDALGDGDEVARGLYSAMLKLRSDEDISESDFRAYAGLRELCLGEPDEMWRSSELQSFTQLIFIRYFHDDPELKNLSYVVVSLEDPQSESHILLFSFPTTDPALLERYRLGDNLQVEQVVQEGSH